jgi:hypothetical protein
MWHRFGNAASSGHRFWSRSVSLLGATLLLLSSAFAQATGGEEGGIGGGTTAGGGTTTGGTISGGTTSAGGTTAGGTTSGGTTGGGGYTECTSSAPETPCWQRTVTVIGSKGASKIANVIPWGVPYPGAPFVSYIDQSVQFGYPYPGAPPSTSSVFTGGVVHYKFEWFAPHGEKAPIQSFRRRWAYAKWKAPEVNGTGTCTTSLGGDVTPLSGYNTRGSIIESDLYDVIDSSSGLVEFDLSLDASAYGKGEYSIAASTGMVTVEVGCQGTVSSPRIVFTEGVRDHTRIDPATGKIIIIKKNLTLIGMKVSAEVEVPIGKTIIKNPIWTGIGGYTWSSDGLYFKEFFVKTDQSEGRRIDLSPEDFKRDVFTLHYYDHGVNTIRCNFWYVDTDNISKSINVESEPLTVLRPTSTWKILEGEIYHIPENDGPYLKYIGNRANGSKRGQDWSANIHVPEPFTDKLCFFGFAQTIKPNIWVAGIDSTVNPHVAFAESDIKNGKICLDNRFPYDAWPFWGWFDNDVRSGDSPSIKLMRNTDYRITNYQANFNTWLIFCPDLGQWVSLRKYTWEFKGRSERSNAYIGKPWELGWELKTNFKKTDIPATETIEHPSWKDIFLNSTPLVRNP